MINLMDIFGWKKFKIFDNNQLMHMTKWGTIIRNIDNPTDELIIFDYASLSRRKN